MFFCNECILECLLAQKKDIQRKLSAHAAQQKQEKEEEEEKLMLQKARDLDAFDQQNHGAVPQYNDKNHNRDKNGSFHGANSVETTSHEEEALRIMKAFWLPSATPEAPKKVDAPSTDTVCPEGKEKLRLKTLFAVFFTEDTSEMRKSSSLYKTYLCPSCKVILTNTLSLVALKPCKERNLVNLAKGGTGFTGHGDRLEATDFKHLESGTGLGLLRPAIKT